MINLVAESTFVRHVPCTNCGSSDGNSEYRDTHENGQVSVHYHCFVCQRTEYDRLEYDDVPHQKIHASPVVVDNKGNKSMVAQFIPGDIPDRKIKTSTTAKYGVRVRLDNEGRITDHAYPYYDQSGLKVLAYKKRQCDTKSFSVMTAPDAAKSGGFSEASLFGQNLFSGKGKFITLVEGELDAMATYQMLGSKWPVVSLKSGANSAEKDIRKNLEFFNRYDKVVLCLDNDKPGKEAAQKLSQIFEPGQCLIMNMIRKDPCEYLVASDSNTFTQEWWSAKPLSPDGIIAGEDIWDIVSTELNNDSIDYPWTDLNDLTYGIRKGELVTVTAGSGIGKSAILREIIYHILQNTDAKIGAMFLEESIRRTGLGLMSIDANKQFHLPTTTYTKDEMKTSFKNTVGSGRMYLYDHFGSTEIDNIVSRIRYMAKGLECEYIFLDHISIVVSAQENGDERKALDEIVTKLRMLVQETNISLFIVSHLKRPQGGGHEIGGVTTLSQLRGSAGIGQLSDIVIGLERDSQAEDPITRNTTQLRVLKNRFSGESGPGSRLLWNKDTGRMSEVFEDLETEEMI
tara:strand:+ start:461 stop:2170 length:1710 start_codon:yes stop_codon:yes gene_type:complete